MDIQIAIEKLEIARAKQRELRKEVDSLREIIREAGYDPDAPKVDFSSRDNNIFRMFQEGKKIKSIAQEYQITPSRVSVICRRLKTKNEDGYR